MLYSILRSLEKKFCQQNTKKIGTNLPKIFNLLEYSQSKQMFVLLKKDLMTLKKEFYCKILKDN